MTIDTTQILRKDSYIDCINKDTNESSTISYTTKTKFRDTVSEIIDAMRVFSCNYKDKRVAKFKKREQDILKDLEKIESKNPDDETLINLKDKLFDLGCMVSDSPLKKEYEKLTQIHELSRDSELIKEERAIRDKSSLFHNRPDLKKHRLELLRIASDVDKAVKANPEDFTRGSIGLTRPIFHNRYKVIFKRVKDESMSINEHMLRGKIEDLKLDKIILPTREVWREREVKGVRVLDERKKVITANVYIENKEEKIYSFLQSHSMYKNYTPMIRKALTQYITLSCYLEVGDVCYTDKKFEQCKDIFDNRDEDPYGLFCPDCRCHFDNLLIQKAVDKDGSINCNFVLCDIDIVKKPDSQTIERLFCMFPRHKRLVIAIAERHNPDLLKDINKNIRQEIEDDIVILPTTKTKSLKEIYKQVPGFNKDYAKKLKDLKMSQMAQENPNKVIKYGQIINVEDGSIKEKQTK